MNGAPYTVAGVMPDGYADPDTPGVDAWVPMDLRPGRDAGNVDNHYITIVARLRPAMRIAQAQAELERAGRSPGQQYPTAQRRASAALSTPRRRRWIIEPRAGDPVRAPSGSCCCSSASTSRTCCSSAARIARANSRVRSALGAERGRLVRQMTIESLTLALAGDVAGLGVAKLAMVSIVALGAGTIPRLDSLSLDPRMLLFSIGVATLAALLFGLAPAIRVARTQPGDVLRGQSRSSTGGFGASPSARMARRGASRARARPARRHGPAHRQPQTAQRSASRRSHERSAHVRAAPAGRALRLAGTRAIL